MTPERVMVVLELITSARQNIDEAKRIVDEETLQVGDRNIIDHAIATLTSEVDMLSRTFREILEDPTKQG